MHEKKTIKNETSKKTSTGNKTNVKHALTKGKESSSCNSCGVCNRLRSSHLSSARAFHRHYPMQRLWVRSHVQSHLCKGIMGIGLLQN